VVSGVPPARETAPTQARSSWWRRHRAVVIIAGIAVVVVAAAGALAPRAWHRLRYGAEYRASATTVLVAAGDRFSLVVDDRGASVGDSWSVQQQPDPDVARFVRDDLVTPLRIRIGRPAAGCCAGTRYFTFDAHGPGRTTIVLRNCFQGCDNARTRQASTAPRWTVIVT